jgi:hypothetical protein
MMSPTDLVNLNNTDNKNGGSGTGIGNVKQQKLGAMAQGSAKRPDSAGERRGRENIPPRDVKSSSSPSLSRGQQQNTKTTASSSGSGSSSRAAGYERQKKKEQQPSSHTHARQTSRDSEKKDRNGGGKRREREEEGRSEKLSSSSAVRLLSSASDSGELGVLGEFFGHATANSSDGTGSGTGSRSGSGSGSGSQGDESSLTPPPATNTSQSASALANSKLLRAAISSTTTTLADSDKETSAFGKETTKATTSVSVETREAFVQTLRLKTGVKFVQTDPLPSVENFKERYERVSKEKKDLQVKLERSEDQKFKMQRDHKREVDKLEKKYYTEARKVGVALCNHVIVT